MSSPLATNPIADLSYRSYDGPLSSPRMRWWCIAKQGCRQAFKKKSLWVCTAFSGWYYLVMMVTVYIFEQVAAASPQGAQNSATEQFFQRIVWKDQILHGFSFGQLWFLVIALILGAGAIANDNRANALLVYLSKPCSKLDYIVGKWVGIFLPLLLVMAIPTLLFCFYGAMSYQSYGFLSSDPWLIVKLAALLPLAAAMHASLVLGISSLFNQGRLAGASYAGLYFLTNFFTQLMVIAFQMSLRHGRHGRMSLDNVPATVMNLYYASIDGLQIGLAKGILGTHGSPWLGIPSPIPSVRAPHLWACLAILVALSVGSVWIAWRRVHAVEVVG